MQDHLNKCFEGIERLEFEEGSLLIKGMYSNLNEYVAFDKQIDPYELKMVKEEVEDIDESSGRNRKRSKIEERQVKEVRPIENWLTDVQDQMRDSLRTNVLNSTIDSQKTPKPKWIFAWAQQIVLVIDQIEWTNKMEKAILGKHQNALRDAFKSEEAKLAELVDLIKEPRGS